VDDGVRLYRWDAADRLIQVTQGAHSTEFTYDGFGRRAGITEKDSGAVTSSVRFVWDGGVIAQQRDAAGIVVQKEFYVQGEVTGSTKLYYFKDHLGSVRDVIDSTGSLRARYDYDPYGIETKVSGDLDVEYGFAGLHRHRASGLALAMYRAYDPRMGRWLSRDPLAESGGLNLYAYCGGRPIFAVDPWGLDWFDNLSNFFAGAAGSLSGGMTDRVNRWVGSDATVDHHSVSNALGSYTGTALGYATGGSKILQAVGRAANAADIADAVTGGDPCASGIDRLKSAASAAVGVAAGGKKPSSAGKMQKQVERGQAPRDVKRVDPPHPGTPEPHVHYTDGTSSTQSGKVHDAHKGQPNPSGSTRAWLESNGWTPPP
jgi:RHS repeat-associated protein